MKVRKVAIRSMGRGPTVNAIKGPPLQGRHHISRLLAKCQCHKNISQAAIVLQRTRSRVQRSFSRFIGVDLGGGRGKTTAVAEVRSGARGAEVVEVATRSGR